MISSERHLAAVAHAIAGPAARLTSAERALVRGAKANVDAKEVEAVRALIVAGDDPLGSTFCRLRSPEVRREVGAIYTPGIIVQAMMDWASNEAITPVRVVDPGCGSGRFLMTAAKRFPEAELVGVETDPLSSLILRANAEARGCSDRLTLMIDDFRKIELPEVDGPTLFIGNPPYVRHHDIGETWKQWLATTATRLGFTASKLAGLHIHFFMQTRSIGRPGDYGAYITSAEWLDVNYGSVLRQMLVDGLGGTSLHVIDPNASPFADTMTTGAITCFRMGHRPTEFKVRAVDSLEQLGALTAGADIPWNDVATATRWSPLLKAAKSRPAGHIELGELFRVHRGTVTGGNPIWVAGPEALQMLPAKFLLPAVTKARELHAAGDELTSTKGLRYVVDLPKRLDGLNAADRRAIEKFLAWAKRMGGDKSYIAEHRTPWWCVGYRAPAPILSTYMARRPPHFVVNTAEARHINIAHGLYPREPIAPDVLRTIVRVLKTRLTLDGGRTYAGGLVKFEPKELERVLIPSLDQINDIAQEMDRRGARKGRGDSASGVSGRAD